MPDYIFSFLTQTTGEKILEFYEKIKTIVDNDFLFYAIIFVAVVFIILLFRPMKQNQSEPKKVKLKFLIPLIILLAIIGLFVYLKFFR